MNVFTIKLWPKFMLYSPRYRRSKKAVHAMGRQVLEEHMAAMGGSSRDLIDDMLAAKDLNGNPFSEGDLLGSTIGPFFAGLDTVANTQSFLLYALHKHPQTLARVQAEVDEHFSAVELPPMRSLHEYKALYGAVLETLRLYPVAPFTPRGVARPFTFAGHRVEVGEQAMIANGLTHFLPEYFPEPEKFDIDRYAPPRDEHHQGAGIFAPYTLGAHTCLGAGVAELQLMITTAALLGAVRLALDPPDYNLKIIMTPIPSPDWAFRMRVVEQS
jgi:cytochrome P450